MLFSQWDTPTGMSLFIVGLLLLLVVVVVTVIVVASLTTPRHRGEWRNEVPLNRWMTGTTSSSDNNNRKRKNANEIVVLMYTYGTRGDVQPLVALARALLNRMVVSSTTALAYRPIVCAPTKFRDFVEKENGVEFVGCGVDDVLQPSWLFDPSQTSTFADVLKLFASIYTPLCEGMYHAGVETHPDLIISQAIVRGIGAQIAERLECHHWTIHFAPSNTPTFDFPPNDYPPSRFGVINKLRYLQRELNLIRKALGTDLVERDEKFHRSTLGFPKKADPLVAKKDADTEVQLHAYSPRLVPKPRDWASWVSICGAMELGDDDGDVAAARRNGELESKHRDLVKFLKEGGAENPPVYVGFGSMEGVAGRLEATLRAIFVDNNEGSAHRVVLQCPGFTLPPSLLPYSSRIYRLTSPVPHTWLFPRTACVVHHGGAGTTWTCARAGVPQIIIPILPWSDQRFWAGVVTRAGIGRGVVMDSRDEGRVLAEAVAWATSSVALRSAREKAEGVFRKEENGAIVAAEMIDLLFV